MAYPPEPTGVIVKYVRHKVSVVRWRPPSQGSLQEPDVFITGSWDNGVQNRVSLWQFVQDDTSSNKHEIRLLCYATINPSVTDIKYLSRTDDGVVASCDDGSVVVFRCDRRQDKLIPAQKWTTLHGMRCSCTSITVSQDGSVVSSGEDNKICHLSVDSTTPLRIIEDADVTGINAVTFSQVAEVLSVSSVGHLKVWDLRNAANKPVKTMKMSGDNEGLHCVQCHPTHPHLVVTGRSDGSVCFWDLRHQRQPLSHMEAHTDIVWDIHFHPSYPNHLFTCSNDGCLWHWDATKVSSTTPRTPSTYSAISPWLTGDVLANGMDVINTIPHNVLPINSLDILSKHLIAGADNEAMYVIPDMIDS